MNEDQKLDARIAELVRKVAVRLPDGIEDKALAKARWGERTDGPRTAPRSRPLGVRLWAALAPAAVLAGLAVLMVLPPLKAPAASSPIAEIRTELELADKNIKIIFIQKPDFNLFKETNHE